MENEIKIISFDLWHTIIKPNRAFRVQRVAALAQALGQMPSLELEQLMLETDKQLDLQTDATGRQFSSLARTQVLAQRLHYVKPIDFEWLYARINEAFLSDPPTLIEPSFPDTLQALRDKNYKITLLSNTGFVEGKTLRAFFKNLKINDLFDLLLFSDEHDMAKPQAAFFEKITQHFGCAAAQVLHIGDNPVADYAGALASNMNALLFAPETLPNLPDFQVINSLSDTHAFITQKAHASAKNYS